MTSNTCEAISRITCSSIIIWIYHRTTIVSTTIADRNMRSITTATNIKTTTTVLNSRTISTKATIVIRMDIRTSIELDSSMSNIEMKTTITSIEATI